MNTRERLEYMVPKIGLRNIKTALAAALCALVYYFLDRSPAFACIGAIFGMGSSYEQSRLHGGNRFFGTLVGGFIGMGLFAIYMELFPDGSNRWFLVPLTFIGVVILILLCQHIWVGGVQPGGVVLCILLFNTPTDTYITYALNRILDTGIGVLISLLCYLLLPSKYDKEQGLSFRTMWKATKHAFQSYKDKNRLFREDEQKNFGMKNKK